MKSITLLCFSAACLGGAAAGAGDATQGAAPPAAVIAVVIDDLGNTPGEGRRVAALPGPVTCSILPHTAHGREIAELAHGAGKEVMLHLPMESVDDEPLGPGGISLDMTEPEILHTLTDDIASIPHLAGVNNHEGSLMTQHPGDMAWIMQALHAAGPYFYIDSYTTVDSVAYQMARENGVPAARRNVFLDDINTDEAVAQQWQRLLKIARRSGFAIAIGHPRSATLAMLERELPLLAGENVTLVPVSRIVALQEAHPLPSLTPAAQAVTRQ